MEKMYLKEIGEIRNSFQDTSSAVRQGYLTAEISSLLIKDEYLPALLEIKKGDFLQVVYFANLADRKKLRTKPPHADTEFGVFSTRSPHRPNPLNICIVQVKEVQDSMIKVSGLDALNGSKILDIKGYSLGLHQKLLN